MEHFLVVLAILGWTSAALVFETQGSDERDIPGQVSQLIAELQKQMPCGFPDLGIPPLAPLLIDSESFAVNRNDLAAQGEVSNFRMSGLDDFVLNSFKINLFTSRVTLEFAWNRIRTVSNFDVQTRVNILDAGVMVNGNGLMDITISGMTVSVKAKYKINIFTQKMTIKDMTTIVWIGGVESRTTGTLGGIAIDRQINSYLEELIRSSINENPDEINEMTNQILLPRFNKVLSQSTVGDLTGGGLARPPCVPA